MTRGTKREKGVKGEEAVISVIEMGAEERNAEVEKVSEGSGSIER